VARIRWSVDYYLGLTAVARNRLRRSRILAKLRRIKRQHPALEFTVNRGDFFIDVEFVSNNDYLVFALLWPTNFPAWETINDFS
jgi:hypothetical protein